MFGGLPNIDSYEWIMRVSDVGTTLVAAYVIKGVWLFHSEEYGRNIYVHG